MEDHRKGCPLDEPLLMFQHLSCRSPSQDRQDLERRFSNALKTYQYGLPEIIYIGI